MQSFFLTAEEHDARAMLLGRRYAHNTHVYIDKTKPEWDAKEHGWNKTSRICADTLEPLALWKQNVRADRMTAVGQGRIGAKDSQFHKAAMERDKADANRRNTLQTAAADRTPARG